MISKVLDQFILQAYIQGSEQLFFFHITESSR